MVVMVIAGKDDSPSPSSSPRITVNSLLLHNPFSMKTMLCVLQGSSAQTLVILMNEPVVNKRHVAGTWWNWNRLYLKDEMQCECYVVGEDGDKWSCHLLLRSFESIFGSSFSYRGKRLNSIIVRIRNFLFVVVVFWRGNYFSFYHRQTQEKKDEMTIF